MKQRAKIAAHQLRKKKKKLSLRKNNAHWTIETNEKSKCNVNYFISSKRSCNFATLRACSCLTCQIMTLHYHCLKSSKL